MRNANEDEGMKVRRYMKKVIKRWGGRENGEGGTARDPSFRRTGSFKGSAGVKLRWWVLSMLVH
jgi:hypothetical protein